MNTQTTDNSNADSGKPRNSDLLYFLRTYADRIWICTFGIVLIPLAVVWMALILPTHWVIKFGYVNSPYWHNIKAGVIIVRDEVKEAWEI